MSIKFILTEEERKMIKKLYLPEESKEEERKFCHSGNVKSLEEIVGDDDAEDYIEGVKIRRNGISGLTDRLELLKTLRLHPNVTDGGEHLAYEIMNQLKTLKPYRFFDEVKKECMNSIDKIIELYKENEHGEELVKDIEKVMSHNLVSPRAKEFLKHSMGFIRGN